MQSVLGGYICCEQLFSFVKTIKLVSVLLMNTWRFGFESEQRNAEIKRDTLRSLKQKQR